MSPVSCHTLDPGIPYSDLPMYMARASNNDTNPSLLDTSNGSDGAWEYQLKAKELVAEALHIARPLIHS